MRLGLRPRLLVVDSSAGWWGSGGQEYSTFSHLVFVCCIADELRVIQDSRSYGCMGIAVWSAAAVALHSFDRELVVAEALFAVEHRSVMMIVENYSS